MDNFIYSLNATLPIFLMILLGKVLIKLKIIDLPFTKVVDRFVFVVALPVLLFKDLTANDLSKDFNGGYVLFCFVDDAPLLPQCGRWQRRQRGVHRLVPQPAQTDFQGNRYRSFQACTNRSRRDLRRRRHHRVRCLGL